MIVVTKMLPLDLNSGSCHWKQVDNHYTNITNSQFKVFVQNVTIQLNEFSPQHAQYYIYIVFYFLETDQILSGLKLAYI